MNKTVPTLYQSIDNGYGSSQLQVVSLCPKSFGKLKARYKFEDTLLLHLLWFLKDTLLKVLYLFFQNNFQQSARVGKVRRSNIKPLSLKINLLRYMLGLGDKLSKFDQFVLLKINLNVLKWVNCAPIKQLFKWLCCDFFKE